MNYTSNPSPRAIPTDIGDELFRLDDFDDIFQMFMEELGREELYSSPTLSWTSSEKLVAAEVRSPIQTSLTTSPMNLEIGERDEMKKRKRQKDDMIIHVFKTKSIGVDALDDGYKWSKYGKKSIRGSPLPRHYYKCSNPNCRVKKKIKRDTNNPDYVITSYEGIHNHPSPSVVYCDFDDLTSLYNCSFLPNSYYCFSHSPSN